MSPTACITEKYFGWSRFKFGPTTEGNDLMKILSLFDYSRSAQTFIEVCKSSKEEHIGMEAID